jgi:porin
MRLRDRVLNMRARTQFMRATNGRPRGLCAYTALIFELILLASTANAISQDATSSSQNPSPVASPTNSPSPSPSPAPASAPSRAAGIGFNLSFVQYVQGMPVGVGVNNPQYGGKLIAHIAIDGAKVGLWRGFSMSIIPEYNFGHNVNGDGGTIFPVNSALAFPVNKGAGGDLSLTLAQSLGRNLTLTVGKFNMVDNASRTPLVGGAGINTFWYLNPAAPLSGLTPPYLTGAQLSISTGGPKYSLMVFDAVGSTQTSGLSAWGKDGVTEKVSVIFPIAIGGRTGYQVVNAATSSRIGTDLSDLADTVLPPGAHPPIGMIQGRYVLQYAFQQYIWQSPITPGEGWGLFGQASKMDGNPTPFEWSAFLGVGGNSPITGRHNDHWGFVLFDSAYSSDLTKSLRLIKVNLGNESGAEGYYNAALLPWLLLSFHLQYLTPANHNDSKALFAGTSLEVKL